MNRLVPLLVLCLFVSPCPGQSRSQPVLRVARLQAGEAACALVYEDGVYRVEKVYRAKKEIASGTIDAVRMQRLQRILLDTNLRKISQEDIHNPLASENFDQVQLGIWRSRGWQNLAFLTSESRKPYRESLDPLLKWFQGLQKIRSNSDRGEKPDNCMPENDGASDKIAVANTAPASVRSSAVFLFRYQTTQFNRGELDETCTIVLPDGTYHWEKGHQVFQGRRRDRIAEGQIDKGVLQELQELLDSPDLKTAPSSSKETWAQEVTGTVLWIGREDNIQHLVFLNAFNTLGNPLETGGMNNLGYVVTSEKILEPLKRWMKQNTDKHPRGTESEGVGNDCYPSRAVNATKSAD